MKEVTNADTPNHTHTHVQQFLAAGLAESTARAYAVGQRWYLDFCQWADLNHCPASERWLILFAALWLARACCGKPSEAIWQQSTIFTFG